MRLVIKLGGARTKYVATPIFDPFAVYDPEEDDYKLAFVYKKTPEYLRYLRFMHKKLETDLHNLPLGESNDRKRLCLLAKLDLLQFLASIPDACQRRLLETENKKPEQERDPRLSNLGELREVQNV